MINFALSASEIDLLETVEDIGFGEIYNIHKKGDQPIKVEEVSEQKYHLILGLRHNGVYHKVVIHDGEPTIGEYRTVINNRDCLVKNKF